MNGFGTEEEGRVLGALEKRKNMGEPSRWARKKEWLGGIGNEKGKNLGRGIARDWEE